MTIENLPGLLRDMQDDLFEGYWRGWSPERCDALRAALSASKGVRSIAEHDVTAVLSAAIGELQEALIDVFLDAAHGSAARVNFRSRYSDIRMVSGGEVRRAYKRVRTDGASPRTDTRSPDVFVVAVIDEEGLVPLAGVEAKGKGDINGGWGWCDVCGGYSNQVICYPKLCWVDAAARREMWHEVAFVWLSDSGVGRGRPWPRGLTEKSGLKDAHLFERWKLQQASNWKSLTWEELTARLSREGGGLAVERLMQIIRYWAEIGAPAGDQSHVEGEPDGWRILQAR